MSVPRPSDEDVARATEAQPRIRFDEFGYGVAYITTKANVAHMEANLRSDDIVICSFPKSGTNWVKQIVQMIRLRGDPALVEKYSQEDLSTYINFPDSIANFDFSKVEELKPRAFFSHFTYHDIAKGARYIYVMRDHEDATASLYNYAKGGGSAWQNHTLDDCARMMMEGLCYHGAWEAHIGSWLDHRENPNILFLKYEDMKENLAREVSRIAQFMGFDLTGDELARVLEFSSFSYMKEKADTIQGRKFMESVFQTEFADSYTIVREGTTKKDVFSPEVVAAFDRHFKEKAAPAWGMPELESYGQLKIPK